MELTKVTTTSGILEPGLWQLDPSQERYRVPACGVIVVDLYPDDVFVVHVLKVVSMLKSSHFHLKAKVIREFSELTNHSPLTVYAKFFPVILKVPVEYVLV